LDNIKKDYSTLANLNTELQTTKTEITDQFNTELKGVRADVTLIKTNYANNLQLDLIKN